MGSWCRNERTSIWRMLPFVVPLSPEQWYTLGHLYWKDNVPKRDPAYGRECGGHVWLHKGLQEQVTAKNIFDRFSVQRYWLNDYPEWEAISGRSLLENGRIDGYRVSMSSREDMERQGLTLNTHYAVAISFTTAKEAMTFKLMATNGN